MKLAVFVALAESKRDKVPVGCDPSWLGDYKIPSSKSCKKYKGFNSVANKDGVFLEKKSNYCPRVCKYGDLEATVQVQCKCKKDKKTRQFVCDYRVKNKSAFKGWKAFNATDSDGAYFEGVSKIHKIF